MFEERAIQADASQNELTEKDNSTQHYEVLMETADCLASTGKYDEAQRHYEQAALLSPDAAGPYVGLGVVALQTSSLEDAEIAFRVACRLDPRCAKGFAGQAMVAQERAHFTEAFGMYLKCLEIENDNMTALLGLFQTSCQMGSFDKIIHYLQVYLDTHPGDTSVMYALGALYKKDGRLEESREVLRNILALQPEYKDATNLLEEVEHGLAQQGQTGTANG